MERKSSQKIGRLRSMIVHRSLSQKAQHSPSHSPKRAFSFFPLRRFSSQIDSRSSEQYYASDSVVIDEYYPQPSERSDDISEEDESSSLSSAASSQPEVSARELSVELDAVQEDTPDDGDAQRVAPETEQLTRFVPALWSAFWATFDTLFPFPLPSASTGSVFSVHLALLLRASQQHSVFPATLYGPFSASVTRSVCASLHKW